VPCVVRRYGLSHDDKFLFAPANPHVSNSWWGILQTSAASLDLPGAYFTLETSGSPMPITWRGRESFLFSATVTITKRAANQRTYSRIAAAPHCRGSQRRSEFKVCEFARIIRMSWRNFFSLTVMHITTLVRSHRYPVIRSRKILIVAATGFIDEDETNDLYNVPVRERKINRVFHPKACRAHSPKTSIL
jgi:hypothetical protein